VHFRHSGKLNNIAAKIDEGERHSRPATGNSRTGSLKKKTTESSGRLTNSESIKIKTSVSKARSAMVGPGLGRALSSGSAADSSFKSKIDGQLAFQETKRRLANQACTAHTLRKLPHTIGFISFI
jgi:hypothetical protein